MMNNITVLCLPVLFNQIPEVVCDEESGNLLGVQVERLDVTVVADIFITVKERQHN